MISLCLHDLNEAQRRFADHIGLSLSEGGVRVRFTPAAHLSVSVGDGEVEIGYGRLCELYRGLALLKDEDTLREHPQQVRAFEHLAAFLDCSRNAVLKVETIKSYAMDLAALGFDRLYLYTEDTYEIPEYPYFGHFRGRYSEAEIREADAFAAEYGVELVPAVQTLAHLGTIFRWNCFKEIGGNGMLRPGEEKVYEFIDKMLASLRRMYRTDVINIGMDEAHGLGADAMPRFLGHIERVTALCEKYGFHPIIWSDMFFKIAAGKLDFSALKEAEFSDEVLERIPKDLTLSYWNYSPHTPEYYDTMIRAHVKMKCKLSFTGGYCKWVGFCPRHESAFLATRHALDSCRRYGITDVTVSGWGDCGGEASNYVMLPGLALYAETCYLGDMSDAAVDRRLTTLFGYTLEELASLELPNRAPAGALDIPRGLATHRPMLWNDPLLGTYDKHIAEGTEAYYAETAERLLPYARRDNRFAYVFETLVRSCEFLGKKAEIGNRMRAAYAAGDREALGAIAEGIGATVEALDRFHTTFRKNFMRENKPFGFQIQDVRFGTMRARLLYTQEILRAYLCGEVDRIMELEEPSLYMDCRTEEEEKPLHAYEAEWPRIAVVNPL